MKLCGLLPLLQNIPAYQELLRRVGRGRINLLDSAKPYFLASLAQDLDLPLLFLTPRPESARELFEEIQSYLPDETQAFLFPAVESLPYERLSPDSTTLQQRLKVLFNLCREKNSALVITSLPAVAWKTVSVGDFCGACWEVRRGMEADLRKLLGYLQSLGYRLEEVVETPGMMARRGGILDFYSPSNELPVRLEFFGQEIESLRYFDPVTQRSISLADSATIAPAQEVLPSRTGEFFPELDFSSCTSPLRGRIKEEMEWLFEGKSFEGMEFYAPLFEQDTLIDYFSESSLIVLDHSELIQAELKSFESRAEEIRKGKIERGELPYNFPRPHLTREELEEKLKERPILRLEDFEESLPLTPAPHYSGRLSAFLKEVPRRLEKRERLVLVSQRAERLAELLSQENVLVTPRQKLEKPPPPGSLTLFQGVVGSGWEMDGLILLSDAELFGLAKPPPRPGYRRRSKEEKLLLSELSPGDYVVHIDHGIARFSGLTRFNLEGIEREYLILEYAEGDRLYVPSDGLDRLSRYVGPSDRPPSLTRLKTQDWARTKRRVKKEAEELAKDLLELYAARSLSPGISFSSDDLWQHELEASFPYPETPDQLEAAWEVKKDMEIQKPMDRLICGDVGYGKTEIALRAAFKAVRDGWQVALLVPTTVLAQQHFNTFKERLQPFPVRTELLSRFRSRRQQQEVVEDLKAGTVDICIGTHRLLQKDIAFKNLGLVIVDEEQRFGVAHKEKLKRLRKEVDVLTLSATPIPRTLHMALSGIREMSSMETPPEGRVPTKTHVGERSEELIREAILRELERGGQAFFVHNRIWNIGRVTQELKELVPEARIGIAHGRLREEELERTMLDFLERRLDVLVCTTIVESGLDLPNVNTLIVNQADKLGLTQLYHLRGRVGRGVVQAHAYFLYEHGKQLTELVRRRLRTILEASSLGSGFRIALRDLEIRGAGSLLGPEQSGAIGAVGFELYSQLLSEAVEKLKAEREGKPRTRRPTFPTIDLPLSAHLPEEYVPGLGARLALYQRLAGAHHAQEVDEIKEELKDRFGKLPLPVKNLLSLARLRVWGSQAGIKAISSQGRQLILWPSQGAKPGPTWEEFHPAVRVGRNQLRLDLRVAGEGWPGLLEETLKTLALHQPFRNSKPATGDMHEKLGLGKF